MKTELTEDEIVFGKNMWIYCSQHLRPHVTGWCTVPVREKLGLGLSNDPNNEASAYSKCKHLGLELY